MLLCSDEDSWECVHRHVADSVLSWHPRHRVPHRMENKTLDGVPPAGLSWDLLPS